MLLSVDRVVAFRVMKRLIGDAFVSAGVLAAVLAVLVSIDVRVREAIYAMLTSPSSGTTAGSGTWGAVGSTLVDAVVRQSIDHAPMMVFVVVGAVLLLCMVRT